MSVKIVRNIIQKESAKMCGICDKKVSKAKAIVYRVRVSGLKGYAHPDCWDAIATDTRVIKEGE